MCKTTWRINEAVELIYAPDAGFIKNETGQTKDDFDLPCLVPHSRELSNQEMEDLRHIFKLNPLIAKTE